MDDSWNWRCTRSSPHRTCWTWWWCWCSASLWFSESWFSSETMNRTSLLLCWLLLLLSRLDCTYCSVSDNQPNALFKFSCHENVRASRIFFRSEAPQRKTSKQTRGQSWTEFYWVIHIDHRQTNGCAQVQSCWLVQLFSSLFFTFFLSLLLSW